jgi:hypothetical protein
MLEMSELSLTNYCFSDNTKITHSGGDDGKRYQGTGP